MVVPVRFELTAYWLRASCSTAELRNCKVVFSAGFEPTTPRLGIWCSIQLSYENKSLEELVGVEGLVVDPYVVRWLT